MKFAHIEPTGLANLGTLVDVGGLLTLKLHSHLVDRHASISHPVIILCQLSSGLLTAVSVFQAALDSGIDFLTNDSTISKSVFVDVLVSGHHVSHNRRRPRGVIGVGLCSHVFQAICHSVGSGRHLVIETLTAGEHVTLLTLSSRTIVFGLSSGLHRAIALRLNTLFGTLTGLFPTLLASVTGSIVFGFVTLLASGLRLLASGLTIAIGARSVTLLGIGRILRIGLGLLAFGQPVQNVNHKVNNLTKLFGGLSTIYKVLFII